MRTTTVNARTELYAILGDPIIYAMSPVIINSAFDRANLDRVMVALQANQETVDEVFAALKKVGLKGSAVTMPVKAAVAKLCDRLEDEALLTGVVNCVALQDGKYVGCNTDSMGFWKAVLNRTGGVAPQSMFAMGAGGFSKAAVAQAALRGCKKIVVANRLEETELVAAFRAFIDQLVAKIPDVSVEIIDWNVDQWRPVLKDMELVGNGTPNGMNDKGDLHEIFPYDACKKEAVFYDAVYKPLETRFRAKAAELGHRTVPGLDFLAQQGAHSFTIWTGMEADADVMRQDAMNFLEAQAKQ